MSCPTSCPHSSTIQPGWRVPSGRPRPPEAGLGVEMQGVYSIHKNCSEHLTLSPKSLWPRLFPHPHSTNIGSPFPPPCWKWLSKVVCLAQPPHCPWTGRPSRNPPSQQWRVATNICRGGVLFSDSARIQPISPFFAWGQILLMSWKKSEMQSLLWAVFGDS